MSLCDIILSALVSPHHKTRDLSSPWMSPTLYQRIHQNYHCRREASPLTQTPMSSQVPPQNPNHQPPVAESSILSNDCSSPLSHRCDLAKGLMAGLTLASISLSIHIPILANLRICESFRVCPGDRPSQDLLAATLSSSAKSARRRYQKAVLERLWFAVELSEDDGPYSDTCLAVWSMKTLEMIKASLYAILKLGPALPLGS
ncbi:uncharacterized protein MYCFIDRAFT_171838 [Pseudocercospora fijiensis CIRAD86]|uniref:Uncharacterized protein n=1 Tax=Pseudocercospora fijiensis (strain CIRAD86) TaxID=383855 RepID=M3A4G9_PSEFD|nr:uncharacterized protein MYCFIDRAFT_171838 [Pseudocercospora fijiensis CIRAD86]EME86014.1 hypothetical protein MYCFIDRAFT_171838 [Pseudocercospora fijiensis CIRAD86]